MVDPGRLFRTARHLRARQIAARVANGLPRPRPTLRRTPPLRRAASRLVGAVPRPAAWIDASEVRLLNRTHRFASGVDWRAPGEDGLWLYNLHYFADLATPGATTERPWLLDLVEGWTAANPPGARPAWEPFPTSRRIVNWIKCAMSGGTLPPSVIDSLALQVRHLSGRVEHHLAGNHLIANAAALVFGGLFFDGAQASRWSGKGLRLLLREVEEQVLSDGGHFERSPMYHSLVLEDLLDVINLLGAYPEGVPSELRDRRGELVDAARRMLSWLAATVHPDGGLAFFNDSTFGVSPTYRELREYAGRLDLRPWETALSDVHHLPESGLVRATSPDGRTLVLFDVGPVGPDYQPGHSHCDSLSLEISRDGERLLVNTGVSTYEGGEARSRERETAAHNTVRIDGREQSEVWASHRCGRRARPLEVAVGERWAEAAHDGYRYLPGRPIHRRRLVVENEGVQVIDTVEGGGEHLLEWFMHLHPAVAAELAGGDVTLRRGGRTVAHVHLPGEATVRLKEGAWHPGFNLSEPNTLIVAACSQRLPRRHTVRIAWGG